MHCLVSRAMAALGALLLLVGMVKPWMSVPTGFVIKPGAKLTCTTAQPRSAIPFRVSCALFATLMGLGHLWHRRTSDRKAMLAASALSVQLFFPCVVMMWEPSISARANWLHIQHENLTWLGGDLCTNLEYSRKSWKDRIYLVDTPRQINVIRMPTSGLGAFQFGRLAVWFDTLGYSNRYCQFLNRGWIASLFGMTLLILGECLPGGKSDRRRFVRAATVGVATFVVGTLAVSIPVVTAARHLERARRATALGLYDRAGDYLRRATAALPALAEDTFFVAQTGLLDFRMGRDRTFEGRLFRANLLERQGRYAQAMQVYQALVAEAPKNSAVGREALRSILREATHALNGGRFDDAVHWFEAVLREEPCNLKANYALQLAFLRTGRRAEIDLLVRQIDATYAYFQMPNKAIVLALSHENAMFAALREGDAEEVFIDAVKVKKP
ncbi:tetratricopeptide repeat protein [Tundrisphaera lichenicola]|uniref:tetratricopeptide repeat protein n=1 Tax=Tundrisphaera lichenicola TaxID=2029860 RepID=UPI003EBA8255